MSTMQDQSRPVKAERPAKADTKTPKAETVHVSHAELTPRERALCHAHAKRATSRLYSDTKAGLLPSGPISGLPSRGRTVATAEKAFEEARGRVLAERDAPEDTAKDALYAAELAREATEAAREEAREAEEREGVYDDLHETGGPDSDDDYRVWE
jgi:hypothetical protein